MTNLSLIPATAVGFSASALQLGYAEALSQKKGPQRPSAGMRWTAGHRRCKHSAKCISEAPPLPCSLFSPPANAHGGRIVVSHGPTLNIASFLPRMSQISLACIFFFVNVHPYSSALLFTTLGNIGKPGPRDCLTRSGQLEASKPPPPPPWTPVCWKLAMGLFHSPHA